jgi:D-glycero-D-manno-heptose 1,7-bisphosphate phosphatase
VALNSDRSVRELKGANRPLVDEEARQEVMAALEAVDAVIIFDSPQVDEILGQLQPDVYVKGGDYTLDTLNQDERREVECHGGVIELIPFVEGYGTSAVVEKIAETALAEDARRRQGTIKTLFLDRDGVLNRERGHIARVADFEINEGVIEAMALLAREGVRCFVVTNQSGMARGLLTESELAEIHDFLCERIAEAGGCLEAIYVSPWHPDQNLAGGVAKYLRESRERKPQPGLIFKAAREHALDLAHCAFVGDSPKDLLAARAAGLRFHGVRSAKAEEFAEEIDLADSLLEVARRIVRENENETGE